MAFSIDINGQSHSVDVDGATPLLWVLRDVLGLSGTKFGCAVGLCGACTVQIDGVAKRSCLTPVSTIGTAKIATIEAIGATPVGGRVQAAWVEMDVAQCGYCQSGQIMSAAALLSKTPQPTDAQIDTAMNGNVCRCGTYPRIRAAIHKAARA
jgi:isoquinoline 1-oxidoreductase alpha subunit